MYLIVGAGITGITLAERIASDGGTVLIIDRRNHIGGNCYDYVAEDGVLVQKYGPHIFHESDPTVIDYVSRFTEWYPYRHKVVAYLNGRYYPIPINKTTISAFFGVELNGEESVRGFLEAKRIPVAEVRTSRDVVVSKYGQELYDAFIHHYTKKQWDLYPHELDRSILERLPVRYDDNPYYFNDSFQGLPENGYTRMFENMLDHPNISVSLNTDFNDVSDRGDFERIVYTGRIDQYFRCTFGPLQYRCIDFRFQTLDVPQYQPFPVVNHPGPDCGYTRCTEFKLFQGTSVQGVSGGRTVILKEYPSWHGEPSYPVINDQNVARFRKYVELADRQPEVVFAGRSGTFRYLNMNEAVRESLRLFEALRR